MARAKIMRVSAWVGGTALVGLATWVAVGAVTEGQPPGSAEESAVPMLQEFVASTHAVKTLDGCFTRVYATPSAPPGGDATSESGMPSVIKERIIFADGRHVLDRTTFTGEGDARVQSHDKYWHDGEHTYYMQLSPDTQAATQLDSPAHAFPTAAGNAFQFSTQTPDLDRYSKMDLDKAHWSDLGEERLRDLATHHLRFTAPEPREGDGAVGSVDVWLAPERGMRWVRREVTWRTPEAGGARVSIDRWTVQEFRSYGDVWMPVTVHQEQLEGSEGALRPTLASTYHAVDLRVNELVDPCSFSHIFANGVTIYGQDRILRIVGDDTHIIQASIAGGDAPRLAEP